jgi:hypothetical protein
MKKIALALGLSLICFLSFAQEKKGNVVLVYQLRYVNKIKASGTKFLPSSFYKVNDAGKAEYVKPRFRYYHIIQYNIDDKKFEKEYVIKYEKDKKSGRIYQRQAVGVTYETYTKVPRDGTSEPHLEYLIGSVYQANGRDVNRGNVLCKMIRGNIPLVERVFVNGPDKVYIPKEMTGRAIIQTSDGWQLFAMYGKLHETITDEVNGNAMTLEQAFDYVSQRLEDSGYGDKLTPKEIDFSQEISFEDF